MNAKNPAVATGHFLLTIRSLSARSDATVLPLERLLLMLASRTRNPLPRMPAPRITSDSLRGSRSGVV